VSTTLDLPDRLLAHESWTAWQQLEAPDLGLWHLINHTAAITELDRLGYRVLAQQALPAHHQYIRLWRSLPDVESELGAVVKAKHDPREPVYWAGMLKRDQARLTHRIKTLYCFYTVMSFIEDQGKRSRAENAFLYLMA
jgi:hypothetical protein